ncbi:hypothetical protein C8F04DRAFT_1177980 [Mycena alexandri]|uniref:Uncharacterized protein n=1 Tax=Mycena alexandri TaxID=1745969 RepID=A0AAD6X9V1_9AGAR|nr:hypothetical protein C8F04DRAFT_1177980 [Mycena alexandri]
MAFGLSNYQNGREQLASRTAHATTDVVLPEAFIRRCFLAHPAAPSSTPENRVYRPRVAITGLHAAHLAASMDYRIYLIYGDTLGGIERKWERRSFRSAAEVWSSVYLASTDVLEQGWLYDDPDALYRKQSRLHALRILACALEARGDTSRASPSEMSNISDLPSTGFATPHPH